MNRRVPILINNETNKVVDCPKFNQSVSFLKCTGTKEKYGTLEVNGKCNSACLEGCSFVEVKVDSVMSTLEVCGSCCFCFLGCEA